MEGMAYGTGDRCHQESVDFGSRGEVWLRLALRTADQAVAHKKEKSDPGDRAASWAGADTSGSVCKVECDSQVAGSPAEGH